MAMRWNPAILNAHLATGLSDFTEADIPDLSTRFPESRFWLGNYFLNSVTLGAVTNREFRFHFLRRTVIAFSEHDHARQTTLSYLASLASGAQPQFGSYFAALQHWEQFLAASWHAVLTLRLSAGLPTKKTFRKGDNSINERLSELYNTMKHAESRIHNGQMPSEGPLPVWLCNAGLRSTDHELTFAETQEILVDLGELADALADPVSTEERLRKFFEDRAAD